MEVQIITATDGDFQVQQVSQFQMMRCRVFLCSRVAKLELKNRSKKYMSVQTWVSSEVDSTKTITALGDNTGKH